jgi:hypothetical protein
MSGLSIEEYAFLAEDFEAYAEIALRLRAKSGEVMPFRLNASQRFVHERLEAQIQRTGRVRAIILKGRQQGVSTYVEGRFYHKVTHRRGFRAFILTHEDPATQNLFEMAQRYHEHCPPDLRPETSTLNAKELTFSKLEGGYRIATAGGRAVGRSQTIQLFHGSEVGYWPNAEEHMAGALEAVPDEPDTEIILESTAKQPGDVFHRAWRAAKRGESRFEAIFVPWFVHEEYTTPAPAEWHPPAAFLTYQKLHAITRDQLYWAWNKNRDMGAASDLSTDVFCDRFKREYPATDDEAFEAAGDDLLRVVPSEWVRLAQKRWEDNRATPMPAMTGMGLDVAQGGEDRTVVAMVHGVRFAPLESLPGEVTVDGPAVAALALRHLRDRAVIAVDLGGGWGGGAFTHLKQLRLQPIGVNPGEGSSAFSRADKLPFRNRRAELWWRFREALHPVTGEDVELPPDDELLEELCAPNWEATASGIQIESKDDIRKRIRRSTDKADAVLLAWRAASEHTKRGVDSERSPQVHAGYSSAKEKYSSRRR